MNRAPRDSTVYSTVTPPGNLALITCNGKIPTDIITDHVRSTTECNVLTRVCDSVHRGRGYILSCPGGGYLVRVPTPRAGPAENLPSQAGPEHVNVLLVKLVGGALSCWLRMHDLLYHSVINIWGTPVRPEYIHQTEMFT